MNIDILNAHCGFGSFPEPRLSEGRLTIIAPIDFGAHWRVALPSGGPSASRLLLRLSLPTHPPQGTTSGTSSCIVLDGPGCVLLEETWLAVIDGSCQTPSLNAPSDAENGVSDDARGGRVSARPNKHSQKNLRPQIRRDYPLNLSISISGGKETN